MTVHASTVRDLPDSLHDEGLFFERQPGRLDRALPGTGHKAMKQVAMCVTLGEMDRRALFVFVRS
jgi:hypothetical protein